MSDDMNKKVKIQINGEWMSFERDIDKELENIRKHKISFRVAALVFADSMRLERQDDYAEEERFITIGLVEKVLFVVYTERKESTRIISARIAEKYEEKEHYDRKNRL